MPEIDNELDEFIKRSTQVEVPSEVELRLKARLGEFRKKVEQRPPHRTRVLANSLLRRPLFRIPIMAGGLIVAGVVALVLIPRGSNVGRAYASAAAQLRTAQSLQYTVELAPNTHVSFSHLAPAYERVYCSWGIEIRNDGTGKQLVLFHSTRSYVLEEHKQTENFTDLFNQLKSLPDSAEKVGEQQVGDKRLTGYRVQNQPGESTGGKDVNSWLTLWVDAATGDPDHVNISFEEPGKLRYEMHIKDIRVNAGVDRTLFDMTPPSGYQPVSTTPASVERSSAYATGSAQSNGADQMDWSPRIEEAAPLTAVVLPMTGSHQQTPTALQAVEAKLNRMHVAPIGAPFGSYESEQHWWTGYPVPAGTQVAAPFQVLSLPASTVASVVVDGPWGTNSGTRWATFIRRLIAQGYIPAGPATEVWRGEDGKPATQSTEMRMAVKKAK